MLGVLDKSTSFIMCEKRFFESSLVIEQEKDVKLYPSEHDFQLYTRICNYEKMNINEFL
jgi:hypothetical protein